MGSWLVIGVESGIIGYLGNPCRKSAQLLRAKSKVVKAKGRTNRSQNVRSGTIEAKTTCIGLIIRLSSQRKTPGPGCLRMNAESRTESHWFVKAGSIRSRKDSNIQ